MKRERLFEYVVVISILMAGLVAGYARLQADEAVAKKNPVLGPCTSAHSGVQLMINTGATATGAPGAPDALWSVSMPASPGVFGPCYKTSPATDWVQDNGAAPTASWLQPFSGGTPQNGPAGTYIYRYQFILPYHPYYYDSINLSGKYAGDNEVMEVRLNGNVVSNCPGLTCYKQWTSFSVSNYLKFAEGMNTIEFVVRNTTTNTGLIARLVLAAKCTKCTMPVPAQPHIATPPITKRK